MRTPLHYLILALISDLYISSQILGSHNYRINMRLIYYNINHKDRHNNNKNLYLHNNIWVLIRLILLGYPLLIIHPYNIIRLC